MRIAYLATDAYGGRGGIALYNRDVLAAITGPGGAGTAVVLPRISGNGAHPIPDGVDWRPRADGSIARYALGALGIALRDGPFDLIYCAHVNLLPVAAMMRAITGAPLLLAIYGFDAWSPLERRMSRWALSRVDHVLTISDYTGGRFRSWSAFPADRMSLVPNAIHLDQFGDGPKRADLVEKYGLDGKQVIMLFGRMDALETGKGFAELIDAMPDILAARPDALLLLAGSGDGQPAFAARAAALGLSDHVRFTGEVAEADKADTYRLADAYVMPSRQEGFGFVHLEAMACGVPAVASNADGAREAVRDGQIGLLIDPKDRASIVHGALAALDTPRGVPPGLSHFAFPAFAERLNACVRTAAAAR
jgi:glycosyltransferase involved in cell wall biosynthesis